MQWHRNYGSLGLRPPLFSGESWNKISSTYEEIIKVYLKQVELLMALCHESILLEIFIHVDLAAECCTQRGENKPIMLYFTFPITVYSQEEVMFFPSEVLDLCNCRLNNLFLLYIHTSRMNALDMLTNCKGFCFCELKKNEFLNRLLLWIIISKSKNYLTLLTLII